MTPVTSLRWHAAGVKSVWRIMHELLVKNHAYLSGATWVISVHRMGLYGE
jgi:hypothetical protein